MASFAASLLDELMGRNRNLNPQDKPKELHWSDPEVCKYFLCGFCPHELFTNTRADLGLCSKIHDEELPKKYNSSSRYMKMGYEEDYLQCLNDMIGEIDRKIRRGHQRLELNKAHSGMSGPIGMHQEKLTVLSDRITELVGQAEKLGCEGRVEEAQGVLKLCDQLKEERAQLQESASNQMTPKEMEVCPVCGAFLVVGDAPQRVEEHASGKQHMGYAKVRATIESLKKKLRGDDTEREARLQKEREERDRQKVLERERKEKEREVVEKDKKDKEREEAEKRDKKDRHERGSSSRKRSRSRSRHGSKKSRSRSRDKHRRSRSGGRDRRSRSRSRDRRRSGEGDRSRDNESSSHSDRRSSHSHSNGLDRRGGSRR